MKLLFEKQYSFVYQKFTPENSGNFVCYSFYIIQSLNECLIIVQGQITPFFPWVWCFWKRKTTFMPETFFPVFDKQMMNKDKTFVNIFQYP